MAVDSFRWPPKARQFQEIITAAVESFQGRNYDYTKSACEQLRERILELRLPDKMTAVTLVSSELTRVCGHLPILASRALIRFWSAKEEQTLSGSSVLTLSTGWSSRVF